MSSDLHRLKRPASASLDEDDPYDTSSSVPSSLASVAGGESLPHVQKKTSKRRRIAVAADDEDGDDVVTEGSDAPAEMFDPDDFQSLAEVQERAKVDAAEAQAAKKQARAAQGKKRREEAAVKRTKAKARLTVGRFFEGEAGLGKARKDDDDDDEGEDLDDLDAAADDAEEEAELAEIERLEMREDFIDDDEDDDGGDGREGYEEGKDADEEDQYEDVTGERKSPTGEMLDEDERIYAERRKKMTQKERDEEDLREVETGDLGITNEEFQAHLSGTGKAAEAMRIQEDLKRAFDLRFADELSCDLHAIYTDQWDSVEHIPQEQIIMLVDRMLAKFGFLPSETGDTGETEFTSDHLFGGPFRKDEHDIEERLRQYKAQYLGDVSKLAFMCTGANLMQGNFGAAIQRNLATIQQSIQCLHQMKEMSLRNWNLQRLGGASSAAMWIPSTVDDEDDKELNRSQKLNKHVNDECRRNGYVKAGRDLWCQNLTKDGHVKNSYRKLCTIRQQIYRVSKLDVNPEQWKNRTFDNGTVAKVEKDLVENEESTIPPLVRTRWCWSFEDVFYDGSEDAWYEYGKQPLPAKVAARDIPYPLTDKRPVGPDYHEVPDGRGGVQYYNESHVQIPKPDWVSWMDIRTPLMDKIMLDQGWSRQVRKWFWVFVGRLAFPLGLHNGGDNWQKAMLLFGKGGTGKSTMAKHMCQMATNDDIFDIESSGETTFALSGAVDPVKRWIWRILEVKGETSSLGSERYQKMVEGGMMGIPRKNQLPLDVDFDLPGIMCGNDRLPFDDSQDSISRRTETWEFTRQVKQNTFLFKELMAELPNDIRKAVTGCRHVRKWVGGRDPHTLMGAYFENTKKNLKQAVDATSQFLATKCVKDPDCVIPLDVFHAQLVEWMARAKKTGQRPRDEQIENTICSNGGFVPAVVDPKSVAALHHIADVESIAFQDELLREVGASDVKAKPAASKDITVIYQVESATGAHKDVTIRANRRYVQGFRIVELATKYGVK